MKKLLLGLVLSLMMTSVLASQVEIVKVKLSKNALKWRVSVTMRHADSGWDHYADAWRIVISKTNRVLGTRTLVPHVNEQPFTRSMTVDIPNNVTHVYVEARDNVHGWSKNRVNIDLQKKSGDRYTID